jgi:hypothetical protein
MFVIEILLELMNIMRFFWKKRIMLVSEVDSPNDHESTLTSQRPIKVQSFSSKRVCHADLHLNILIGLVFKSFSITSIFRH